MNSMPNLPSQPRTDPSSPDRFLSTSFLPRVESIDVKQPDNTNKYEQMMMNLKLINKDETN